MTQGIGTHRGVQAAAPSRIAYKPVANRVQPNQTVQNRIQHQAVENRVADNAPVQRRVNIAA
jgi:hypothetical protein